MLNVWLFYITANIVTLIIVVPYIDRSLSPLSRYARMTMAHAIFTSRNKFFPFISPRVEGMDSDSKALDELISLYHPALDLSENLTTNDIEKLRYHSKRLLTSLHPVPSSSCLIQNHFFQYDSTQVNMYSIQHHQIEDWKNSDRPLILYFHGGGFVFGGIETYSGFECHLSKDLDMLILHVNLRLAPESSLEDIIEDVIGVYRVLLDVNPNIHQRLIGMGDSTGGMLWIYLLQWLIANQKSVPQAVVLHSPWPNLDFLNINFVFSTDSYLPVDLAFRLRQLIIGKDIDWFRLTHEEREKVNPKDNFQGFPPLYITAGTNEIFIDEICRMTKKIRSANVEVILDEGIGLMHTYALFHLWSSKARCVQETIRQWIQEKLLINTTSTWNTKIQTDFVC
jgi:acetyl esterase/lipase